MLVASILREGLADVFNLESPLTRLFLPSPHRENMISF